jgi:hypothetical protein
MDHGRRDRRAEKVYAAHRFALAGAMESSSRPYCLHCPRGCQNLAVSDRRLTNAAARRERTAFRLAVGTLQRHCSSLAIVSETVARDARLSPPHGDRRFYAPRHVRGQVFVAGFVGSLRWHAVGNALVSASEISRPSRQSMRCCGLTALETRRVQLKPKETP